MIFTWEGKEYECRGVYRHAKFGDYYLNEFGGVGRIDMEYALEDKHVIIHPVERLHTFGGVVFRETGEVREAANDWVLIAGMPIYQGYSKTAPILEPVRIEKE